MNTTPPFGLLQAETFRIVIPRELSFTLHKAREKFFSRTRIFLLRDDAGVSYLATVANSPGPDKEVVSFRITRALKRRLVKLATLRQQTLTDLVESLMVAATRDIELSPDDYHAIAEATKEAREKKARDGRRKSSASA